MESGRLAVEIVALIAAVEATIGLIKAAVPVVQEIRVGMFGQNKKAQEQLTKNLEELQSNLKQIGELAQITEGYFQTLENVLELQSICSRTEGFLKDTISECRNSESINYKGNWRVLDTLFQVIDSNREAPKKVILARAEWYDKKDKEQIELLLQQFNAAYERATISVRGYLADDLLYELRSMTSLLQDVITLLRNTVYNTILKALQKLTL